MESREFWLPKRSETCKESSRSSIRLPGVDMKSLEADFVKIAERFGEQRGIGYGAWRDAGVPAEVLKRGWVSARTRG